MSQIYLYAETNFQFGRYYLPFLVALPLTISFLNQKKIVELLSGQKKVFLYFGSILTIVLILIFNLFGTNTINKIKNIEKSKRLTTKIFSSISNYTTENDSILIVGDPGTNFESMSFGYTDYIKQVLGRYNIFYLPLEVDYENEQHLINLKNSFMKFAEGRSYASKDIDLYNFKYILVLNSTSWYKGRKFGDNKKAFQDILISQASESKHFLRLKFASMTSYVRHEGDFVDGLTPLYEEAPIYITRINETKVSYKELNNLQNWKIPKADYYSINGFVHKEVSAVYLGIDSSFVRCTFKTNTSKKGEHNSKFNCLFNNKLQDNISDHVFTPVLITKDSSSYWFLGKPY
ncbi:MAG: hypothetical protein HKO89_01560, partial [Saprospiraceae bacterium]|nr:hypothetical protein [Saprospiraceae bacterium]